MSVNQPDEFQRLRNLNIRYDFVWKDGKTIQSIIKHLNLKTIMKLKFEAESCVVVAVIKQSCIQI